MNKIATDPSQPNFNIQLFVKKSALFRIETLKRKEISIQRLCNHRSFASKECGGKEKHLKSFLFLFCFIYSFFFTPVIYLNLLFYVFIFFF